MSLCFLKSLRTYAENAGISSIGWLKSDGFPKYLKALEERKEYHEFNYKSYKNFIDAGQSNNLGTIVVIVVDYFFEKNYLEGCFRLSNYTRFCWQTVNKKTELITRYIRGKGYIADLLNTPNRASACKAGLGFIGKNCMFYAYGFGSYVGIVTIGTNFQLPFKNNDLENIGISYCKNCNLCVLNCPTNAIDPNGYRINPFKCISFVNRHPEESRKIIFNNSFKSNRWLHGCEICQDICPLNKSISHQKDVIVSKNISLYGMKLPNKGSITRNILKENIGDINSKEYLRYVNHLMNNK